MKQTLNFRVMITLFAICMGLLIIFGTFSLGGMGFTLEYSYFDVFKNTDHSFKAEGVLRLRLAGGVMLLTGILAWVPASFAALAGAIASGGFFAYDTIRRLATAKKYGFFEGFADFCIYILPVAACILCLLLFLKQKQIEEQNNIVPQVPLQTYATPQPIPTTTSAPRVVDLRSEAEKRIEQESKTALADPVEEALAQELFRMFQTSRPYDSMEMLNMVVTKYSPTAQMIANKGCNPALKKVYYRVKALCNSQGVYFHSGTVDSIFEGEYWSC